MTKATGSTIILEKLGANAIGSTIIFEDLGAKAIGMVLTLCVYNLGWNFGWNRLWQRWLEWRVGIMEP